MTRTETALATRLALLDATISLLATGGPSAVTLRAVGDLAGVSRSAPYRHFADKDELLMAAANRGWNEINECMIAASRKARSPATALRAGLLGYLNFARAHPDLYQLMFAAPAGDTTTLSETVGRAQATFLQIVGAVVGEDQSSAHGGVLLAAIHGIADLELSGHLPPSKWGLTADELAVRLVQIR